MFDFITGKIAEKSANYVVLDAGGVGFKVYTSINTLQDTSLLIGSEGTVYTYLYLKEGIMDLYGFSTREERELFELLISVSGVGAKGALAVLSVASPSKLAACIVAEDIATIKSANGIGAKTAQRIVLELKDKVSADGMTTGGEVSSLGAVADNDTAKEAVSALMVLGYTPAEARKAVSSVDGSITDVEEIVKQALKKLF